MEHSAQTETLHETGWRKRSIVAGYLAASAIAMTGWLVGLSWATMSVAYWFLP